MGVDSAAKKRFSGCRARVTPCRTAADVIENLSRTLCVGRSLLSVRPSIGTAIYPDGGVNGNELIDNADAENACRVERPAGGADSYESPWVAGVATTCPFFMGSVAPGLADVRTTPSLPS